MVAEQRSVLPKLPLDDLLAEVQLRLDAVRAARDGVGALLEAVVSIGRELELEVVLRRIIEAARSLVDARYAALGIIGEDQQLAEFIPVGVTEDEIAAIEEWPHGRGILGLLIRQPKALRLEDIKQHPESFGFPRGHPAMKTFLGVPIRIRDDVFGNLYLTDKGAGQEFDRQDEAIVTALAAAAGVAIDNARLYEQTRAREIWLEASGDVTRELLSGAPQPRALQLVAERAVDMAHATMALVVVPAGDNELIVAAGAGTGTDHFQGLTVPREGTISGSVMASGNARLIRSLRDVPHWTTNVAALPGGPAAFVPLGQAERVRGVIAIHRRTGGLPFTSDLLTMLTGFADQVAVVMELADARRETERLELIDDRTRIARDLHDVVIQRLFASAMMLTSTIRMINQPTIAERVQTSIDDLDDTIRQIRSSIFALQSSARPVDNRLRSRVMRVVDAATEQLGFTPGNQLDGLLDTDVPDDVAEHTVAVIQEGLSNVVRHAGASRVDVVVTLRDNILTVEVCDNGLGISEPQHRRGLANLQDRANELGGMFTIRSQPAGGTTMRWRVPV